MDRVTRTSPSQPSYDVVVPTIGRPSLATLLMALAAAGEPGPRKIIVVDDRVQPAPPLAFPSELHRAPQVVVSGGRGPAAARNAGWRQSASPWVVFLDDDVVPSPTWTRDLAADLAACGREVAAVQARVSVPLPEHRRPTDYERNVAGLQTAAWITADLAVRREALIAVGGFDERFRRAYREDTDLALRLSDAGWTLAHGSRAVSHPPGRSNWRTSIAAQRGNADDALMRRLHGKRWRDRGAAPHGSLAGHVATSGLALTAATMALLRARRLAIAAAVLVFARVAKFWWRRAAPGPRRPAEWMRLLTSSVAIPFAATTWWVVGQFRARRLAPRGAADKWSPHPPALVLFDRDGTLIHDVAYNGDPAKVRAVAGAPAALDRLRAAGVAVGMITNQSGIGRGLLTGSDVEAVNRRVEELLGPFVVKQCCPHTEHDGCACRKPQPGMVLAAARAVGVDPKRCAVIGDIGSDVRAALAAGARGVLVPNGATAPGEIVTAPEVAPTLADAVDLLIGRGGG
jgi:histidinol-phosphate phosphatase family protein